MKTPSPMVMPSAAVTVALALPFTPDELRATVQAAIDAEAARAVREAMVNDRVISFEEAVAMTPWNDAGFRRVANKHNLPYVKGLKKTKPGYRLGALVKMLREMQVWPHGKPEEVSQAA